MKKFTNIRKLYEQELNELDSESIKVNNEDNRESNIEKDINEVEESSNDKLTIVNLFSKIFESREMANVYHLQVNGEVGSNASHLALGIYYNKITELIDDLIEIYSGQYGIVDGYDSIETGDTRTKEKVVYFEEVVEYIKNARKCIDINDTHLHNIVDEIVALLYKTLYKLKFLK